MRKIRDFFDDLTKSTLVAGGNPKSYGNFEIWQVDAELVILEHSSTEQRVYDSTHSKFSNQLTYSEY